MERRIKLIEVNQPIGRFYIGVLDVKTLIQICEVRRRSAGVNGIQRDESIKRVKQIAHYCTDPDATFPTSIVLGLNMYDKSKLEKILKKYGYDEYDDYYENIDQNELNKCRLYRIEDDELIFDDINKIAEIIDGQHRIWGIRHGLDNDYTYENFEMPVVFMEKLKLTQKGYIFSTINSTQTKVNKSLIYDLFGISEDRSPQKTCNIIARAVNSNPESPFYNRLKMLGTSADRQESISQGSFINYLIKNITLDENRDLTDIKNKKKLIDNEKLPLRYYFIHDKDETILKIILNIFNALKEVFPEEWDKPDTFILSKAIGYGGVMKALPSLYKIGEENKDLSQAFFEKCFIKFKNKLEESNKELTSKYFISGKGQSDIAKLIRESIEN